MKPASTAWLCESNWVFDEEVAFQKRFHDPDSDIPILRLTSQPVINSNIYPEAPISTPDGKRFIFRRTIPLGGKTTFWMADIETLKVRQITDEDEAQAPIITPDGKWIYYSVGNTIWSMSPESFEREKCFTLPDQFEWITGIRSVDFTGTRFLAAARGQQGEYGAAAIDLTEKRTWMVFSGKDVRNPHEQYSRNAERKVLIQVNDGVEVDEHGNLLKLVGENGASLQVVNENGSQSTRLNVGASPLERVQGHQCWVGKESVVITTLHRRELAGSPWIQDRIVVISPGEATYRIVGEGQGFTHIHTDPSGKWWVSDCNRTADIFVGSIQTGRYRFFCHSGATFGCGQETHPHPFFLGDGKSIAWNSDVTGIPHIYFARIPNGYLESLLDSV